ncbi:MAG TPA: universal stress protein, partial [Candidatus Obscuribacterales bacterium]
MNTRGLTELIVLNIGLSLGVISPLLFTMLVIMALVTTFMTSPLLEWTYPKKLIRLDIVEPEEIIGEGINVTPTYRILVPIANPSTQKELLQLAAAIAGTKLQPAVIHPLSLIQLEEDYLFQSTPIEADRLIKERRDRLEELTKSLEPPEIRHLVHPIVRIANDVARATADIAKLDQADLILMGWHHPAFSTNRLGGRVGQILSIARVDVAVLVSREDNSEFQNRRYETLLVPYSANTHDDLALEIAMRLLINGDTRRLSVLRVVQQGQVPSELSNEFSSLMEQLPASVRSRIELPIVEATNPISGVVEASGGVDLTIAGTSRAWGIERQTLGRYTDQLAVQCLSSLLITRRYSKVTSHLASVVADTNEEASIGRHESGVEA